MQRDRRDQNLFSLFLNILSISLLIQTRLEFSRYLLNGIGMILDGEVNTIILYKIIHKEMGVSDEKKWYFI